MHGAMYAPQHGIDIAIPSAVGEVSLAVEGCNEALGAMLNLNWPPAGNESVCRLCLAVDSSIGARHVERVSDYRWRAFGVSDYTALKVAVRGVMSDARVPDTAYVHGSAFSVLPQGTSRAMGVLLFGASGSGKTTLLASLSTGASIGLTVVNDDWGPVDVSRKLAISTRESRLHMKMESVEAICPPLAGAGPGLAGEAAYPHDGSRVFVSRDDVFSRVADVIPIDACVVLTRTESRGDEVCALGIEDALALIEMGAYSSYFGCNERFMNGSLLLDSAEQRDYHYGMLRELLGGLPIYSISNAGSEERLIDSFAGVMREWSESR